MKMNIFLLFSFTRWSTNEFKKVMTRIFGHRAFSRFLRHFGSLKRHWIRPQCCCILVQKLVVLSRTTKTYSRLGTNGIRGFAHSSVVTRALSSLRLENVVIVVVVHFVNSISTRERKSGEMARKQAKEVMRSHTSIGCRGCIITVKALWRESNDIVLTFQHCYSRQQSSKSKWNVEIKRGWTF